MRLFQGWHGKMVERAAPGGEGDAIDHFSISALNNYLGIFDKAFAGTDIGYLRSFFNDSYEVDDARGQSNWTPDFLEQFQQRRGYDLAKSYLPCTKKTVQRKTCACYTITGKRFLNCCWKNLPRPGMIGQKRKENLSATKVMDRLQTF